MFPEVDFSTFLALIILSLTLGIILFYKKYTSIYSDFPAVNFLKIILKCTLLRKIPKHVKVTSFYFQTWIDLCKQRQSEGLCLFWMLRPYLLIFDEEAFKIFGNDHTSIDKPFDFEMFKEFWGTSLLTLSGDLWRKRRKLFNPLFYKSVLKDKAPLINKNSKALVKQLMEDSPKESVVLLKHLKMCAVMNISEFLTGDDYNTPEYIPEAEFLIDAITKSSEMAIYRIFQPWLFPKFMLITSAKGRTYLKRLNEGMDIGMKYIKGMADSFSSLGKSKEKEIDENYRTTNLTFVDVIKEHVMKDSSFTLKNMKDEFAGLFTAGFDTVSYGLMWSLFLLGHHTEVQDRLFEEVDSFMVSSQDLSGDDLKEMEYLDCVIKESLRLYPPVPVFGRYLSKDTKCGKYTVPKGTNILFFLYLYGRDPMLFPDPEKFDPERFINETSEQKLLTWSFAEGARNCIGKYFALMEMKIVLAHIIKNFKITSLDRPEDVHISWEIVLTTAEPLHFQLRPRCPVSLQE